MNPHPPRILVLRGGAIGDFIATLPALHALRTRWPDAYIELIGYPHIANLARIGGLVDRVDSLDRAQIARLFAPGIPLEDKLRERLASFDFVLTYLHDPDRSVETHLRLSEVPDVLYASPIPAAGRHITDHLVAPLERLALYETGAKPALDLNAESRAAGKAWLAAHGVKKPPVALHAGSGSPRKNWPVARFIEVARRLHEAGDVVLFVLGEADGAIAPEIREAVEAVDGVLAEGLELVETAGVLASCAAYLGNDSGISHLAAALGLPSLALFGPSDPKVWGPRGVHASFLHAPEGLLEKLGVPEVLAALAKIREGT